MPYPCLPSLTGFPPFMFRTPLPPVQSVLPPPRPAAVPALSTKISTGTDPEPTFLAPTEADDGRPGESWQEPLQSYCDAAIQTDDPNWTPNPGDHARGHSLAFPSGPLLSSATFLNNSDAPLALDLWLPTPSNKVTQSVGGSEPGYGHHLHGTSDPLASYRDGPQGPQRVPSGDLESSGRESEAEDGSCDDNEILDFDAKTNDIRLTHFQNLNKLLILVFSGREISEADWCLSHLEAKILNSILQRKFASKMRAEGIRIDETDRCTFVNRLGKINTLKRPKDCYKMLLGRLFRILKRNFFEKNASSNQNMYLFYQYYFGDTAKAERLPIQAYFYPFERNNKFTSLFPKISHHLNFRYYERIFKSERFAKDIRLVLNKVYADHFAELRFKFSTLLRKWERLFFSFDGDQEIVEKSILKYLQHNNRCKIPFTALEIRNSIVLFENMIAKFGYAKKDAAAEETF